MGRCAVPSCLAGISCFLMPCLHPSSCTLLLHISFPRRNCTSRHFCLAPSSDTSSSAASRSAWRSATCKCVHSQQHCFASSITLGMALRYVPVCPCCVCRLLQHHTQHGAPLCASVSVLAYVLYSRVVQFKVRTNFKSANLNKL